MRKFALFLPCILLYYFTAFSQPKVQIYNPEANAISDLRQAIQKAAQENKHVFIVIGGNWCPWCIKFHRYVQQNTKIDSLIQANYVVCLINYSKENKNQEVLRMFEYPQRFGFPVFVILNQKGERIHTQDSGLLESGENYDDKKVIQFLKNWSPKALDPSLYE
ncbi:MAG TPA: thioredoxin family protein [Bacteroidales bacterium]|nr:thioredoxin family protein [Bacteroidales bacterium]